jgi:hypothetical protein
MRFQLEPNRRGTREQVKRRSKFYEAPSISGGLCCQACNWCWIRHYGDIERSGPGSSWTLEEFVSMR